MKIGIDFGTSYSAAAALVDDKVVPILFDGQPPFRTAIFFPDVIPNPEDFPRTPETAEWIQREFIVQGDASFGVVDGLARYAGLAI